MRAIVFLTAFLLTATTLTDAAHAQTALPHSTPPSQTAPSANAQAAKEDLTAQPAHKSDPYQQQIHTQALALAKELNDQQVEALAHIREGFGMIRTVHMVDKDVDRAVTSCEKAHPDIKQKMADRYSAWHDQLDPKLAQGEKDMNAAIDSGAAGDPKKLRAYLATIDKAANHAEVFVT